MTRRRRAPRASGTTSGYQLGPGVWVRLRYAVFDADGEPVQSAPEETGVVFGYGALLPGVEEALQGATAGSRRSVELEPEEAYGRRDPEKQLEVAREDFPSDVAPGDRFEVERDDGTLAVVSVLEVADESVVVDLNHPLAGQRVRFEVEVLEARAASSEELEIAEASLLDPPDDADEAPGGLISPASLLRRGVQS